VPATTNPHAPPVDLSESNMVPPSAADPGPVTRNVAVRKVGVCGGSRNPSRSPALRRRVDASHIGLTTRRGEIMISRRQFLHAASGAAGLSVLAHPAAAAIRPSALRDDWQRTLDDAVRHIDGRAPEVVAEDEDFWRKIRHAFTVDRTIINLNNGGVSPSPRVVQEAMA